MSNGKQQNNKIISLEDDAKVPDTFGLERFMQEVNILELEGYYFCPNKNQAGDLSRRTISPSELAGLMGLSVGGRQTKDAYRVLKQLAEVYREEDLGLSVGGLRATARQ